MNNSMTDPGGGGGGGGVVMQSSHEVSQRCLNPKALHYNSPEASGSFIDSDNMKNDQPVDSSFNKVIWAPSPQNHYSNGAFYQQDFLTWQYMYSGYPMLQYHNYTYGNHIHHQIYEDNSFPVDNRIQNIGLPLKMFFHQYPYNGQLQEFKYFVVIDFEATCDKDRVPQPQEIIEFPSVVVNGITGQLEASFQTYVRPTHHQLLTDFCKELTGIQQNQVDRGVPLSEALYMHDKWLVEKGIKNFAVVTWSDWDCRVMLESECKFKRIRKPPYFNRWINLKVPFQEVFGSMKCKLKQAVELAGLSWEGREHSGLDDARNTARLLALLMQRGCKFNYTNSLNNHPTAPICRPPDSSPTLSHHPSQSATGPIPTPTLTPTLMHFSQFMDGAMLPNDAPMYCFCGAPSRKCVIRRPGPTQGRCFFGCGRWTATGRATCDYFVWAVSP